MKYIVHNDNINLRVEKQWLTRNSYAKDAVKALGALAKPGVNPTDEIIAPTIKMSKRRYQEAKRELVFCGLLEVHKINSVTLVYLVGPKAIIQFNARNADRELTRVHRLTLESMHLVDPIDETTNTEVHESIELPDIAIPKPINIKEEDIL